MEIWKNNEVLYDGAIVRLRVGEVTLDNGAIAKREVVEHDGGVCILPFTGDSVILVRQFRIALNEYILEAPAGKLEGKEDPEQRGRVELEEETGYRAGRLVSAGAAFSTVGYCSEKIHYYLAFDLTKTEQRLEEEERIELVEMPLAQVREDLLHHRFEDGKTIIILHALVAHLDAEKTV